MRAVTGTVTSSEPISLSKATAILSRFAAADIGARRDVAGYLNRSSIAFEDLVECHRDLRSSRKRAEIDIKQEVEDEDETRRRKKEKGGDPNPGGNLQTKVKAEERRRRKKKEREKMEVCESAIMGI